jgi:hypothetical protein
MKLATDERCDEFLRSVRRLLVTANVPSSPILIALMMEAILSFETSVLTRAIRLNSPEDGNLHPFFRFTEHILPLVTVLNFV